MKFTLQEIEKIREIRTAMDTKPDKIRTWWKIRGIADEIAETVLQHVNKLTKAAHFYWLKHPELDLQKMIDMARFHDTAEYKEKDYIPQKYGWEISPEEKHSREKAVMMELKDFFWEKWQVLFDLWMEFEKCETPEAKIVKQLDKIDGAVQAMEYEKMWYTNVVEFYPNAMENLTDPVLIKILNILLKKEYPHINTYDQYFTLLKCNGDETVFKEKMEKYSDNK